MVAASPPLRVELLVFEHGRDGLVGMPRYVPFEHFNQGSRSSCRRHGGESGNRRFKTNSLQCRRGTVHGLSRSWMVSASLMVCVGSRTRNARSIHMASSVRPRLSIPRSRSIRLDASTSMKSRTLRMRLAGQTRDDRDHVTFAQSLICRGIGLIHRHGSKNRKSVQQRFDDDQAAPLRCSVSCRGACYPAKQSLSSDPKLMSHYQMPGAAHPPLGDRRQRSCYAAPFAAASIHWRTIEYSGGFSTMIWRRRSEISPVAPSRASQPPSRSSPPPRPAES